MEAADPSYTRDPNPQQKERHRVKIGSMSIGSTGHKPMTELPAPVEHSSSGRKRFR
jgi:hypothetical protein